MRIRNFLNTKYCICFGSNIGGRFDPDLGYWFDPTIGYWCEPYSNYRVDPYSVIVLNRL